VTDRENLIAMFARAGVGFVSDGEHICVTAQDTDTGPNLGYLGFYTDFTFDESGSLISVGSWE
jgi:hypothetical protein